MKFKKSKNFSEWYSEVVQEADLADLRYNLKGFLVHKWLAVKAMKLMYGFYERELERRGHKPILLPALIPEKNFELEAEHAKGFSPEVFWVMHAGSNKKKLTENYALRPTSETAMYQMYSLWIRSWRDLPFKAYQSCQVWRYEGKATRPFIRGREFYWIETHNVFSTKEEAEKQVLEDMKITEEIMHKKFCIPFIFFRRPAWDKFSGAVYTFAADSIMPNGRAIQQPSTHFLSQNFAKAFGVKFRDKDGKEKYGWQTCYGPAIWRMLASIIGLHGDDYGLIFPPEIAPVQAVVVPIPFVGKTRAVVQKAKEIFEIVKSAGYRAELDLTEKTPGNKFYYWELRGVPIRIEIGPEDLKKRELTIFRRDTREKIKIKETALLKALPEELKNIQKRLLKKADRLFKNSISEAENFEELKEIIKSRGGFVRVNFCSVDEDGKGCAERIKEELQAAVRGMRVDKEEKPSGKCVVCGRKAKAVVYVGTEY